VSAGPFRCTYFVFRRRRLTSFVVLHHRCHPLFLCTYIFVALNGVLCHEVISGQSLLLLYIDPCAIGAQSGLHNPTAF
jgi:hypothetical protein